MILWADAIIARNKELVFWTAMEECLLVKCASLSEKLLFI